MLVSAPLFGSNNIPVRIRILFGVVMAMAMTPLLRPYLAAPPSDLYGFALLTINEAVAGLIIGIFVHLVILGAQMGGALMDIQIGLSMSNVLNPSTGQPSTVLSQFKYFLALVLFLCANGHHVLISAFMKSFELMPTTGMSVLGAIQEQQVALIVQMFLIALQIAAPILAVSILIDAALGIMNKAVPQMQIFIVGMPGKIIVGMIALSVALPAVTMAVVNGVESATQATFRVMNSKP
jgi:flagellar biosynthetic protein FliR